MSETQATAGPPATQREPLMGRDDFKKEEDRFFRIIRVPEFSNRKVRLRSWLLTERMAIAKANRERKQSMTPEEADVYLRAHAVQESVVDAQGNLVFGPADVEWLKGKGAKAMERLFDVISSMNALSEDEETQIEKN